MVEILYLLQHLFFEAQGLFRRLDENSRLSPSQTPVSSVVPWPNAVPILLRSSTSRFKGFF
jgi:hypothetical protein